jgi:hypothetical protein
MNTAKARKLQYLLITELLTKGSVQLTLPDGIILEIGTMQEDEFGELKKSEDYCYVVATRDGKSVTLDTYSLGLQYASTEDTIIYEDEVMDKDGSLVKILDVV